MSAAPPAHVRMGDLLCMLGTAEQAMLRVGRLIPYYRENAPWSEPTYGFMERQGLDTVRAVVVEDRDGDGERL